MSHITHFYHLAALDYIQGPSIPPWTTSGGNYFNDKYFVSSTVQITGGFGSSGSQFFGGKNLIYVAAGATGDVTPILPPTGYALSVDLTENNRTVGNFSSLDFNVDSVWEGIIYDYVLALQYRRQALECAGVFAGRVPFVRSFVAGGVTTNPTTGEIAAYKAKMQSVIGFITGNYVPLTEIAAAVYTDYDNDQNAGVTTGQNYGYGYGNFLAFGVFNEDTSGSDKLLDRGYITGAPASGSTSLSVGTIDTDKIKEYIDNSRYDSDSGDPYPKHPLSGYTDPNFSAGYSWIKSPRYDGQPMEVGPLARMVVDSQLNGTVISGAFNLSYKQGTANPNSHIHTILGISANDISGVPSNYNCGVSVMDRHRARALEALKIALRTLEWCDELNQQVVNASGTLAPSAVYDDTWSIDPSKTYKGFGMDEAPRGALSHWVNVKDGKIDRWQSIVPTTWNANPRDASNNPGPIEQALINPQLPLNMYTSVSNGTEVKVPVEALRVIHSFDPCIACAVHVVDGKEKKTERQVSKS